METKPILKSKRFWGFVAAFIGQYAPTILPNLAPVWEVVKQAGEVLFGVGVLTANKPLSMK